MPKREKPFGKKNRSTRNGWATPAVVEHEGKVQVITTASRPEAGNRKTPGKVISYDLENGSVIWECSGLTDNAIPCPIVEGGVAYCMTGYKAFPCLPCPFLGEGNSRRIFYGRGIRERPMFPHQSCMTDIFISPSPTRPSFPVSMPKQERFSWNEPACPDCQMSTPRWSEQVIIFTWSGATVRRRCSKERVSSTWWLRTPWPTASMPRPRWQAINFSCVDINFSTVLVSK